MTDPITGVTLDPAIPRPGDEVTATLEHPGYRAVGWPSGWVAAAVTAGRTVLRTAGQVPGGGAPLTLDPLTLEPVVTCSLSWPVRAPFPLWLSPYVEAGETLVQSWRRHIGYGSGLFIMRPAAAGTVFDQPLIDLASTHGTQPVPILFSPKSCTPAQLEAFLAQVAKLAPAWLRWLVIVPFQEPWDNYTTAAQAKTYRDWIASLGPVAAKYGVTIGLETQADAFWYTGGRADRQLLDAFVVPGITAVLLASVYSYNGKDDLATQVPKIAAKAKSIGLPWAVAASAMPVKAGVGAAQSAAWSGELHGLAKANGAVGHGHYSYRQGRPPYLGMIDGDSRLPAIPELMAMWRGVVADAGALT